ncbi:MAG TPA: hypothetical protein VM430_18935 [Microbacterium sp.]|nr:hypothetical protein [Microbacterium sp.]
MNGSAWTRRAVAAVAAVLLVFVLACNGGAPRNPTPVPSQSTTPYPHPTQ